MPANSSRKFFFNFRDFDHKNPTSSTSTLITSWKLTINKLSFNFLHQIFYFLNYFCLFIFFSFSFCIIYFHSSMFNEKINFCFIHTQNAFFRDQNENFVSTLWLDELKNQTKQAWIFFSVLNCEKMRKKRKQQEIFHSKNSLLLLNVSAWSNISCTYSCQCCSTFSRAVEVFLCFSLSHFLCRKILTCTFSLILSLNTRRTFFSQFTITCELLGTSALLHVITHLV